VVEGWGLCGRRDEEARYVEEGESEIYYIIRHAMQGHLLCPEL
jgi:hypothetical protein